MQGVGAGFRAKSDRLSVRVAFDESQLLHTFPQAFAETSLPPMLPQPRREVYRQMRLKLPVEATAKDVRAVETLLGDVEEQIAYGDAADIFDHSVRPRYAQIASDHTMESAEVCTAVDASLVPLQTFAERTPIAGVFNHIGTMQMACHETESALAALYRARALDPEHVTVYESLAYALWILNKDSRSALATATEGLDATRRELVAVTDEYNMTQAALAEFSLSHPLFAASIREREDLVRRDLLSKIEPFKRALNAMIDRLTLQYCYFSALELQNRSRVRDLMLELYKVNPQSPDVQDTMGFVLMRFATGRGDLDEARRFFKMAVDNKTSDPTTQRMASAHLEEWAMFEKNQVW
jgi:hypothetical protein